MTARHIGYDVSEIYSHVAGSDGNLHAAAMVWSLEHSADLAKPWGNRAQCYFYARFLVINHDRDFKPGGTPPGDE